MSAFLPVVYLAVAATVQRDVTLAASLQGPLFWRLLTVAAHNIYTGDTTVVNPKPINHNQSVMCKVQKGA